MSNVSSDTTVAAPPSAVRSPLQMRCASGLHTQLHDPAALRERYSSREDRSPAAASGALTPATDRTTPASAARHRALAAPALGPFPASCLGYTSLPRGSSDNLRLGYAASTGHGVPVSYGEARAKALALNRSVPRSLQPSAIAAVERGARIMQSTASSIRRLASLAPPQVPIPAAASAVLPFPQAVPFAWRPASIPRPGAEPVAALQLVPASSGRCAEKGCVFPAAGSEGKCLQHLRQSQEPILFSSWQPTRAVMERARFELPSDDTGPSRSTDRRQLLAIREAFLEE